MYIQHALKNASKINRNRSQNHEKSVSGGDFGGPGGILAQTVEKVAPRGSQNAAKLAQDAAQEPNMSEHGRQVGVKMELSWPTWRPRWATWEHFGRYLGSSEPSWHDFFEKCRKFKKPLKTEGFLMFFGG